MKLETASFLVGALLVGIALFGGGIEIKEIKIGKVSRSRRAIAGCAGLVFILVGLIAGGIIPSPLTESKSPVPDANSSTDSNEDLAGKTPFILRALLGKTGNAREIETQIVVFIEGKKVAEFVLDADSPSKSVELAVSKPGEYRYHLEGYTMWTTARDEKIQLVGRGTMKIDRGTSYIVAMDSVPSSADEDCEVYIRSETF